MHKTFLKGILMGLCDVVPGISGGTIALLVGIYERLMRGVSKYTPRTFFALFSKDKRKNALKDLDLRFFIPLAAGVGSAIYVGSLFIPFLLKQYFFLTMAFFVGLIVASAVLLYRHIEDHKLHQRAFLILGFIVGVSLLFLVPLQVTVTYPYIFFSGFFAIWAMFLPGISGSYILVLLGSYTFLLEALHNLKENYLFVLLFLLGAILGALTISRIVVIFLKRWHAQTLYLLIGLVLGSLSVPITRMMVQGTENPVLAVLLFLFGAALVYGVAALAQKR